MASRKYQYRLNPRHWRLSRHIEGDIELTHEPRDLTAEQAKKVLELERNGIPLAVRIERGSDDPEAAAAEAADAADAQAESEAAVDAGSAEA